MAIKTPLSFAEPGKVYILWRQLLFSYHSLLPNDLQRPVPASQLKYLAPRICTCLRVPPCLWAWLPFTHLHCKDQHRSTLSWCKRKTSNISAKFGCDLWPRMWPFQVTMLLFLALHTGLTVVRALEEALPGRLSPLPQVGSWQVSCCNQDFLMILKQFGKLHKKEEIVRRQYCSTILP